MMAQMLYPQSEIASHDRLRSPASAIDLHVTVRDNVIPRLKLALADRLARPVHPLVRAWRPGLEAEIGLLGHDLLANDLLSGLDRIEELRRGGITLGDIYTRLLAPTACHLRDLWAEDFCGLAEVTVAFCNLRSLLRHYAPEFYGEAQRPDTGMRALLVSPWRSGSNTDVELFGVLLLSDFFRRDGWDAWIERGLSSGRFRDTVLSGWFDLVEVLVTGDDQLDEVASGIRIIRRGSPNPSVGIMVCGDVFRDHPEFVGLVGADLMATDPLTSLSQAQQFVTRPTQRRRLS